MRFVSTRGATDPVTLSTTLVEGLAGDGGLFVPERFPSLHLSDFGTVEALDSIATILLHPFFTDDPLHDQVAAICAETFTFPAPLLELAEGTSVLQLFHGPTAAFKDFGARFLAAALSRVPGDAAGPRTVLVATSGDTGGAVAAAFHGRPGVRVVILYPRGRVSPLQERQLGGWSDNVRTLAVRGDFDDCQRLVRSAFADVELAREARLTSANSINLGRLLPQMAYHARAALEYLRRTGVAPGFIVPTGNLGNAVACLWAQRMGLPIREVVLATNANETIPDFFATGRWRPRPAVQTLATAMDVGDPSNFERLTHLFGGWAGVRRRVRAIRVDDEAIRAAIDRGAESWGVVWDPHTATAAAAREQVEEADWVLVATAHPAKFPETVEPIIGREVDAPPALVEIARRTSEPEEIEPELEALSRVLRAP